ncbi:MAG TPA: hemolysin family protein [Gemmatimonadaceae bacterium]|nr:hemolysin family protein [Gemmatimonadaceae bacterium]
MGKLVTIISLLALNAFFVAAEFALVRSRRTRLESMVEGGDPLARLALRAMDNLTRMLAASQLGITLASLGLGWVAEGVLGSAVTGWLSALPIGLEAATRVTLAGGIALAVATYLHVVLGELYPRAVGLNHPEQVAKWLAIPLLGFAWIARPVIFVFYSSARGLLKATGQKPDVSEGAVHSADEIRMLVEQSQEQGTIEPENAEMLDAVFEFTEKKARDVMTPRTRMIGIPVAATLEEALAAVEDTKFSRYPVYQDTLDDVIGMVLVKDLLPMARRRDAQFDLRQVMRTVHFVPGSREVEEVLADFKRRKTHLAIVLDEFGGTAGLVTMEDLLEELVGEILDEHDEAQAAARNVANETIIAGETPIGDVNERLGLEVPDDEYTTIGGYVFGMLGRLPALGDRVAGGGAQFAVRKMDGRRIAEVAVKKDAHPLPPEPAKNS